MIVVPIDEDRCYLMHDDREVKLYVRRNGMERMVGYGARTYYRVTWTLLRTNAEILTREDARLALEELCPGGVEVAANVLSL